MNHFFKSIKYYSLFPYLDESINYVNSLKITIDELITSPYFEKIRFHGEKKIINTINNSFKKKIQFNDNDALIDLLSYPYIKIILSCINNIKLTKKYIYFESLSSVDIIKKCPYFTNEEIINFGLHLNLNIKMKNNNLVLIHFYDYTKYSTNFKDISWKLINRKVENGYVTIDFKNYYRFLQEVISFKIEKSFLLKIPVHLKDMCIQQTENICNNYLKNENVYYNRNSIVINTKLFPNCISNAIFQINNGINISHSMRFALVTFLYLIGMKTENIIRIFSSSPDFSIEQVKYQINHIISNSYKCPSCSTMKTYGNCENICSINNLNSNPVTIYYKKIKNN